MSNDDANENESASKNPPTPPATRLLFEGKVPEKTDNEKKPE